jgi:hypothetical protein
LFCALQVSLLDRVIRPLRRRALEPLQLRQG